jgi:hypothetical protein
MSDSSPSSFVPSDEARQELRDSLLDLDSDLQSAYMHVHLSEMEAAMYLDWGFSPELRRKLARLVEVITRLLPQVPIRFESAGDVIWPGDPEWPSFSAEE